MWHCQQAIWRYLWARDHNVLKKHRKPLFKLFRSLVNARTRENFDRAVDKLFNDELASQYPDYQRHIRDNYLNRPEMWAMYSRFEQNLPTNGISTNNFLENSFRILKENVFHRCKVSVFIGFNNYLQLFLLSILGIQHSFSDRDIVPRLLSSLPSEDG